MTASTTFPARRERVQTRMPAGVLKNGLALMGAIFGSIPTGAQDGFKVLLILLLIDTLTGVWLAFRKREFHSARSRGMLVPKLLQYACITGLGWGGAQISHFDHCMTGAVAVCVLIEVASILENLNKLERYGGAPLGPARPFLSKVNTYFAVVETRESVTRTTVSAVEAEKEKVS